MSTLLITISVVAFTTSLYMYQSELRRLACKAFGFVVIGHGFKHRHYTLSFKEAVSWAACYGDGASIYRKGICIASKMPK